MRSHDVHDPVAWLPDLAIDRVIVSCTARARGRAVVRLPDRHDAHGPLAAILVETEAAAREVLTALDRPGRVLALDVERKQAVDLMALARELVRAATVVPTKPNDATVRSLDVLLTHVLGPDLTGVTAGVLGTGNLGLKSALLLAERGATLRIRAGTSVPCDARWMPWRRCCLPSRRNVRRPWPTVTASPCSSPR